MQAEVTVEGDPPLRLSLGFIGSERLQQLCFLPLLIWGYFVYYFLGTCAWRISARTLLLRQDRGVSLVRITSIPTRVPSHADYFIYSFDFSHPPPSKLNGRLLRPPSFLIRSSVSVLSLGYQHITFSGPELASYWTV